MPFLATSVLLLLPYPALSKIELKRISENIITALVNKGISRNAAHEEIRVLSQQASQAYKLHGLPNDLFERLRNTKFFEPIHDQLDDLLDPEAYIGRSPQQVEKFTGPGGEVEKALEKYQGALKERGKVDLKVWYVRVDVIVGIRWDFTPYVVRQLIQMIPVKSHWRGLAICEYFEEKWEKLG